MGDRARRSSGQCDQLHCQLAQAEAIARTPIVGGPTGTPTDDLLQQRDRLQGQLEQKRTELDTERTVVQPSITTSRRR